MIDSFNNEDVFFFLSIRVTLRVRYEYVTRNHLKERQMSDTKNAARQQRLRDKKAENGFSQHSIYLSKPALEALNQIKSAKGLTSKDAAIEAALLRNAEIEALCAHYKIFEALPQGGRHKEGQKLYDLLDQLAGIKA